MESLVFVWILIMIAYIFWEKRWMRKQSIIVFYKRRERINKIRKQEYARVGILKDFKPLTAEPKVKLKTNKCLKLN